MKTWKSKLFGDNRVNFYGWIATGLIIMGLSIVCVLASIFAGAAHSGSNLLLMGIYVVLLGQFGLSIQNYCSRVASKLESRTDTDQTSVATPQGLEP